MTLNIDKLPPLRFIGSAYSDLQGGLQIVDEIDDFIQDSPALQWLHTGHVFLWKNRAPYIGRFITGFPNSSLKSQWQRIDLGGEFGKWSKKAEDFSLETLDICVDQAPMEGLLLWIYNFHSDDGEYYESFGEFFREEKDILPS